MQISGVFVAIVVVVAKLQFKNLLQKREDTFSDDVLASVAVVFA